MQKILTADEIHEIADQVSINIPYHEIVSAANRRADRYPNRYREWVLRLKRAGVTYQTDLMTYNECREKYRQQLPFVPGPDQGEELTIQFEEKVSRHLTIQERRSEAVNRVRFQED